MQPYAKGRTFCELVEDGVWWLIWSEGYNWLTPSPFLDYSYLVILKCVMHMVRCICISGLLSFHAFDAPAGVNCSIFLILVSLGWELGNVSSIALIQAIA